MLDRYKKELFKKLLSIFFATLLLAAASLYSLTIGSYEGEGGIFSIFFGKDETLRFLVTELRLPRVLSAILVGSALAVSGAVMQNILRNRLASPFTLGVSQGAAFGATAAIVLFGAGALTYEGVGAKFYSSSTIAFFAFLGALISSVCVFLLSMTRRSSPEFIALGGIAIGAFFGACTMLLQYFATDFQLSATIFWSFGDLSRAGYKEIWLSAAVIVPSISLLVLFGWSLNAALLGDLEAVTLGVNIKRLRVVAMLTTTLLAAVATAFYGIIGFVGLIAPHIARFFVGDDFRYLTALSGLLGALLLLLSDMLARTALAPAVLPVGIVTSLVGAPLFLYLAIFKHRGYDGARG